MMRWVTMGILLIAVAGNTAAAWSHYLARRDLRKTNDELQHPDLGSVHLWIGDRLLRLQITRVWLAGHNLFLEARMRSAIQTLNMSEDTQIRYDIHDAYGDHSSYVEAGNVQGPLRDMFVIDDKLAFTFQLDHLGGKHCHRNTEVKRRPRAKQA